MQRHHISNCWLVYWFMFSVLPAAHAGPPLKPLSCEKWSTYERAISEDGTPSQQLPPWLDQLIVSKTSRKLIAFWHNKPAKEYAVSIGQNPIGAKAQEGDLKTPEGQYFIQVKNPDSRYHLSLQISYPSSKDLARARRLRVPPGNSIMLHGFPIDSAEREFAEQRHFTTRDWTQGCVAVDNNEIEELYSRVVINTPILICP